MMQQTLSARHSQEKVVNMRSAKDNRSPPTKSGRRRNRKRKHEKNRAGQQNHDFPTADLGSKEVKHLEMRNRYFNNLSVSSAPVHARGMPRNEYVYSLFKQALDSVQSTENHSADLIFPCSPAL